MASYIHVNIVVFIPKDYVKRAENLKMARQYKPIAHAELRAPRTQMYFKLTVKRKTLQKYFHCPLFQIHPRGHSNVPAV